MSGAFLSVVIPVHNGARFLSEALESVAWQTFPADDVIVVDDGSTDCSAEIAEEAGAYVIRQPKQGVSAARNAGVEASLGQFIAFLDADDIWLPDRLERQLELIPASAGWVSDHVVHFLEGQAPLWYRRETMERAARALLPSGWLLTRTLWDLVGGFDTSYSAGEDVHWVGRARAMGIEPVIAEEVLHLRRVHDANLSGMGGTQPDLIRALRSKLRAGRP